MGDLNAHYNFVQSNTPNTDVGVKLFHFLECNNFFQLMEEATRITLTGESILDLVISDTPGLFVQTGTLSPPYNCDHNVIFGRLCIPVVKHKCYKRRVWNFNNINEEQLDKELAIADWNEVFLDDVNIDSIYYKWISLFLKIVESFIPSKIVTIRPHDKPWMNATVRRAINKRNRLFKAYSKNKTVRRWNKYRIQRNGVVNLIRNAKQTCKNKTNELLSNPLTSAKTWWKLVKLYYGRNVGVSIPPLFENGYVFDPEEKAELFNDFFCYSKVLTYC